MLKKFLCAKETNKLKALETKGQFNVAALHKHKRTNEELPPLLQVDHRTLTFLNMSTVASYYHHLTSIVGICGQRASFSKKLDYRVSMLHLLFHLRREKCKAMILEKWHLTYLNKLGFSLVMLFFVPYYQPGILSQSCPWSCIGTRMYKGNILYLEEKII